MKRRNLVLTIITSCLVSCFLLPGCNGQRQIDSEAVKSIQVKEDAHLQDDEASPTCKITMDYSYLAEAGETDTIAQRINRTVQIHTLGEKYANLTPEAAVDSFKNEYIATYRKSVDEFYLEDLKNGMTKNDLPSWYNYEYSQNTRFSNGKEGILNFISETSEYTGGAHPNSWIQWMNFDKSNGKLLTLKDVFLAGSEKPLSQLLLKELIAEMADRMEGSPIKSLEDLQNAGILTSTDIYVPENFLLEAEDVSFLYNSYDIAPYATGIITLTLPYTSVEKYMIH